MLEIINLSKTVRNHTVIPQFSLILPAGRSAAIHCPGEASVALMRILLGEQQASNGRILLDNQLLPEAGMSRIAFVLREEEIQPRLKVGEYLRYWSRLFERAPDPAETLEATGLKGKEQLRIDKLRRGERVRLQLSRCMLQNPQFFVLEDPGQNTDRESLAALSSAIRRLTQAGKSVLVTASAAEHAEELGDDAFRLGAEGLLPLRDQPPEKREEAGAGPSLQSFPLGKIPARRDDKIILFNAPEINYIESASGGCLLFVNGEAYNCSMNLGQLEKRLQPFGFYRCHRSYLVNLQQVREIESWTRDSYILKLEDVKGSRVPLSKNKFVELKEQFGM